MKVLLFGRLRDVAGWRERTLNPTPARLSELRARLAAEDEALGVALSGAGVHAAVDRALVRSDCELSPTSEVAFMPPMSGG